MATDRQPRIEVLEDRGRIARRGCADTDQCDLLDRSAGECLRGRTLQEPHALVEQIEAVERVADHVDVGEDLGKAQSAERDTLSLLGQRPRFLGDGVLVTLR